MYLFFVETSWSRNFKTLMSELVVIMVGSLSGRYESGVSQARSDAVVVQGALMRATVCRRRRRRRPRHDLSHQSRDRRARSRKCTTVVLNLVLSATFLYFRSLGVESITQIEAAYWVHMGLKGLTCTWLSILKGILEQGSWKLGTPEMFSTIAHRF